MEKKYKVNYTSDGRTYIIFNDQPVNISLLHDWVIKVIAEPIDTYVIIDEDKLKSWIEFLGDKDEKY